MTRAEISARARTRAVNAAGLRDTAHYSYTRIGRELGISSVRARQLVLKGQTIIEKRREIQCQPASQC